MVDGYFEEKIFEDASVDDGSIGDNIMLDGVEGISAVLVCVKKLVILFIRIFNNLAIYRRYFACSIRSDNAVWSRCEILSG